MSSLWSRPPDDDVVAGRCRCNAIECTAAAAAASAVRRCAVVVTSGCSRNRRGQCGWYVPYDSMWRSRAIQRRPRNMQIQSVRKYNTIQYNIMRADDMWNNCDAIVMICVAAVRPECRPQRITIIFYYSVILVCKTWNGVSVAKRARGLLWLQCSSSYTRYIQRARRNEWMNDDIRQ